MPAESVRYSVSRSIAWVSLNRPEKLNAIDAGMITALHAALDRAESDEAVRVIVLSGEGRAFSAGFDLTAGEGQDTANAEFWRAELRRDFDIIMRFWDCPKVTVAAVHGYCLGSAMEMALACDLTLAAEGCRFGAPEVRFGSGIVAMILPWLIGMKAAKELLLTGDDRVDARRALALGMVNRVVEEASLRDEAQAMGRRIAVNDQLAVRATKRAINRGMDIQGLRAALSEALALDAWIESTETAESMEFNRIMRERGVKAALAWRESRLDGDK